MLGWGGNIPFAFYPSSLSAGFIASWSVQHVQRGVFCISFSERESWECLTVDNFCSHLVCSDIPLFAFCCLLFGCKIGSALNRCGTTVLICGCVYSTLLSWWFIVEFIPHRRCGVRGFVFPAQLEVDALRRWEISQFKKLADSDLDAQYGIENRSVLIMWGPPQWQF